MSLSLSRCSFLEYLMKKSRREWHKNICNCKQSESDPTSPPFHFTNMYLLIVVLFDLYESERTQASERLSACVQ